MSDGPRNNKEEKTGKDRGHQDAVDSVQQIVFKLKLEIKNILPKPNMGVK